MTSFVGLVALCAGVVLAGEYPIEMPKMGSVRATGGFWGAREATNRLVTARANLQQSESSGRIANFENAGKVWLFFGHGDIRRVELKPDGLGIAPGAQIEHVAGVELGRPGFSVEDVRFPNNFTEGASVYRHGGWWYLFVSEGFYTDHTYRVGVGRAKTLDGAFVDKEGRQMKDAYSSVVLRSDKDDEFFGPGHNGEIVVSPSGKTYMFYHCHWTGLMPDAEGSRPKYIPRPLCLQEIKRGEDGWPYFDNSKPAKTGAWE